MPERDWGRENLAIVPDAMPREGGGKAIRDAE